MPTVTSETDTEAPTVLLRVDVWTARMRARGYTTVKAQATRVGCARSALTDLIAGRAEPRRQLIRRMAAAAETTPARLFKLADS